MEWYEINNINTLDMEQPSVASKLPVHSLYNLSLLVYPPLFVNRIDFGRDAQGGWLCLLISIVITMPYYDYVLLGHLIY